MASCSVCGGKIGSCKCTRKRKRRGHPVPNKKVRRPHCRSSVKTLPRVKDMIIGVTLGGMRVTAKELRLIQIAYNDGFQAGRKSRG